MNELEIFYQAGCPYCRHARRAEEELMEEKPLYKTLPVRWIEENQEAELANSRDYYYVPTIYLKGEKFYEARRSDSFDEIKANLKEAFDEALVG